MSLTSSFDAPICQGASPTGKNALVEDAWEDESGCQRVPRRRVKLVTCLSCPRVPEGELSFRRFRWLQAFGHLFLDWQSGWTGFCPQLHEAGLVCLDGASEELSAVRGHRFSRWFFAHWAVPYFLLGELSWS